MARNLRLFGIDDHPIVNLDDWFAHAPPEGGESQWADGYSAKEQAQAWLRPGHPAVPAEVEYALGVAGFGDVSQWTGCPEHQTRLDSYGRGGRGLRHHDMLLLLGEPGRPSAVVGIEAKACEGYDGTVGGKVATPAPSRLPDRCNLMAQALFGRSVCDPKSRTVVDGVLGAHGYQLWTGSVGAIREAQALGVSDAIFLVHQFVPGPFGPAPDDNRAWDMKLSQNASMLHEFRRALGGPPSHTQKTESVEEGTTLHVVAVCSPIAPAETNGA